MQKRRLLFGLGPQRQRVVRVVVHVDQSGQHKRAANVNDRRSLGTGWAGLGASCYRDDDSVVSNPRPCRRRPQSRPGPPWDRRPAAPAAPGWRHIVKCRNSR
jgi:hypothetical protein